MTKILLAPNPTGTGHNMRVLALGKKLIQENNDISITVLLGSRQDVFTPLFEKEGITVIDLSPTGIIDYSKSSNLEQNLDWQTMITNYFVPTFFNGDKILKYMTLINTLKPDLLISDYNINATFAAVMSNTKNAFVTERHNFTLVDVSTDELEKGKFKVETADIISAQKALNELFLWLVKNVDLIITDKVFMKNFKSDVQLMKYSDKTFFVGSMYADRTDHSNPIDFDELGIDSDRPYIVATVSNTTMLAEDKENSIKLFIESFKLLKKTHTDIQLVLLGIDSENQQMNTDLIFLPYLPNWRELIENSTLLIAHPGWITVTEVSLLNIPTLFYLASYAEYHEVEAYKRLEQLDLPVYYGDDIQEFTKTVSTLLNFDSNNNLFKGYEILSPYPNGLEKATNLLNQLIKGEKLLK